VANPKGKRYTYKVVFSEKINKHFVYLMTGPSNEDSFTYMGMLYFNRLKMTQASKYCLDSTPVQVFNWVMKLIEKNITVPENYFIEHNGHCGRCGRKLTTPESIKSGLGPICRSKQNG